ncbi:MAG: DUF4197 domain-containing protein [Pseudomonadota bacterium]
MKSTRRMFIISSLAVAIVIHTHTASAAESLINRGLDMLRKKDGNKDTSLSNDDMIAGIREALNLGATKVANQLGKTDGFNADPAIHIPLPPKMNSVKTALARVGMAGSLEDLEVRLNRAAEAATPVTKQLFLDSIKSMTMTDVASILRGNKDAATQYFKRTMSPGLSTSMQPIVKQSLTEVGALKIYDQVMARYNGLPLVPKIDLNLNDYVVQNAMNGIFHYLGQEEAAIRDNPVARTTDLLKRVFGAV